MNDSRSYGEDDGGMTSSRDIVTRTQMRDAQGCEVCGAMHPGCSLYRFGHRIAVHYYLCPPCVRLLTMDPELSRMAEDARLDSGIADRRMKAGAPIERCQEASSDALGESLDYAIALSKTVKLLAAKASTVAESSPELSPAEWGK